MPKHTSDLITDEQSFNGATYRNGKYQIPTYDDGYGPLWISRNSIGINGIVRARNESDAYSICEDEFFPEADETLAEIQREYGFRREHRKVIRADESIPESERHELLGAYEKFDEPADYSYNGRLPDGKFIRWVTIDTPDADAWPDNELFCEAFGFRPNGANKNDKHGHAIYAKDLNGDCLDVLTPEMVAELELTLDIVTPEAE
jgi:hypothetical protein